MGESHENLLKAVRHCQQSLDKYTENRNDSKLLHYLQRLHKLPIKVVHLEETGVGRTVNGLRKLGGDVGDSAKGLVSKWKDMVVGEQEEEEDDEDEEDGYQTGEDESDSDDEEKDKDTSSHRKSDSNRTEDRSRRSKQSSSSKKEERHKHKHKSHKRESDSSSEDETPAKRPRKGDEGKHRSRSRSEDEHRHRSKKADSASEEESKNKEKKHKSEKHKSDKKKSRESSIENEKSSKSKEKRKDSGSRDKDKHKSSKKNDSKRHEHSSKTKDTDNEKKNKHKEKVKRKSEDKEKTPKPKVLNGELIQEGIGSGSGASFAEALGMCEPSSSKGAPKKKTSEKKEKPEKPVKVDDPVPKLLKEPAVEPPLDINLSSLLPPITPNYRPLGNLLSSDSQSKKFLSESEALSNSITSKNQRTKVYSGNKVANSAVPSLFELCIRLLQDHIDALEYTGGVPYHLLKPILEKANPNQLYLMEHHNPYLIEDTDELWALHCQREFRNKERQEMETWRDMYLRCLDERDARLKALTANIKQAQDKSLPVRMTKLAYVDAVAKPPRNIARKQAKNGTAFDVRKPAMTPSAKLTSLATAGEAGKVAVPNPGSRAVERSSGHASKPKKAPLMLKSITSFKNRFKR